MKTWGSRTTRGDERRRQLEQLHRLQRQIDKQRRKIAELERVKNAVRTVPAGSMTYEGTCADCGVGVIVRTDDTLRCTVCGFRSYL
ncbi:hypothetical protein [Haladaptatus salinisoli]|uniref:hypothetical protein n=1 Tax=Haladaptatus salinisoli TaxID=2884876 RepID=UPI001D0B1BF2|nr:hypothetical protein [Haladaptatus salinisoli]